MNSGDGKRPLTLALTRTGEGDPRPLPFQRAPEYLLSDRLPSRLHFCKPFTVHKS
jgi:hypothetical protein